VLVAANGAVADATVVAPRESIGHLEVHVLGLGGDDVLLKNSRCILLLTSPNHKVRTSETRSSLHYHTSLKRALTRPNAVIAKTDFICKKEGNVSLLILLLIHLKKEGIVAASSWKRKKLAHAASEIMSHDLGPKEVRLSSRQLVPSQPNMMDSHMPTYPHTNANPPRLPLSNFLIRKYIGTLNKNKAPHSQFLSNTGTYTR